MLIDQFKIVSNTTKRQTDSAEITFCNTNIVINGLEGWSKLLK